jgi:hypothetical protein
MARDTEEKSGGRGAWLYTFSWRVHSNIGGEGCRGHCCCVQARFVGQDTKMCTLSLVVSLLFKNVLEALN